MYNSDQTGEQTQDGKEEQTKSIDKFDKLEVRVHFSKSDYLSAKGGMIVSFEVFIQMLKIILLIFKMFKQNKTYRAETTVVINIKID